MRSGSLSRSVTIGDLDSDGAPDLAVANFRSDYVSILRGGGDGSFAEGVSFEVGDGPQSVAFGDFNGDGAPDLSVANYEGNDISILMSRGEPAMC